MWNKSYTLGALICVGAAAAAGALILAAQFNITTPGATAELWEDGGKSTAAVSGPIPDFVKMARDLKPTVVNISTTKIVRKQRMKGPGGPMNPRNPFEEFFGPGWGFQHPGPVEQRALGSGFIINKDGYILTNNHVVEGADEIKVKLWDNREFDAKIIGRDPKTDLALIKISAKVDLPFAPLGNSDAVEIGEWVMAIGHPFGFGHTVTKGIISAKARNIGAGPYDSFLQTDAPINQGNSGGPLFNGKEEVVGINTAIAPMAQGIGFAIPINMAKDILPQLKEKGKVTRGWLGVEIQPITQSLADALGLKELKGALVAKVVKDSPADKSGIKEKDVIVGFNGKHVEEYHDLPAMVALTPLGSTAAVTVIRGGKTLVIKTTIEELPEGAMPGEPPSEEEEGGVLGMTVQEINEPLARQFGLKDARGVVITDVEPGSPAADAGLRPGDIIREINQKKVQMLKDYRAALEKIQGDKPILLLIQRGDSRIFVAIKPSP